MKFADERHTSPTDTLTQLIFLFEKGRKVKEVFPSAGLFLVGSLVTVTENVPDAKKLELQTLPALAAESLVLHTKVSRLEYFVKATRRDSS